MDQKINQNEQEREKQITEKREYFEVLKKISENKKINKEAEEKHKKFIISESSNNDIILQVL